MTRAVAPPCQHRSGAVSQIIAADLSLLFSMFKCFYTHSKVILNLLHNITHARVTCPHTGLTSGTQSKMTVPLWGKVAHTQLTTVPGHGLLSGWDPKLNKNFLDTVMNRKKSWHYFRFLFWPLKLLPVYLGDAEPVVGGVGAADPPELRDLDAGEAHQAGEVWGGRVRPRPHRHHSVHWLARATPDWREQAWVQ